MSPPAAAAAPTAGHRQRRHPSGNEFRRRMYLGRTLSVRSPVNMHPVRALCVVVCCLALVAIAQEDSTDNATDSCPPIPNCDIGYTCKVVKHPDNCPICKCVPCDNKPCLVKEGFSCRPVQQSNGCMSCRCQPCLRTPPCESPCSKSKSPVGCPICECPGAKGPLPDGKPEVENMPLDFQNDAENSFDP